MKIDDELEMLRIWKADALERIADDDRQETNSQTLRHVLKKPLFKWKFNLLRRSQAKVLQANWHA